MNKHLSAGQLRAALDGELSVEARQHLEACPACQTRQRALRSQAQRTADKLAFLSSAREQAPLPAATAWSRFHQQKLIQKEYPMFKKLFAVPLARYGIPALLVLTFILAFPGARALASQLLDLFRVQQVTVVPIDVTGMEQLNGNDAFGKQMSKLISDSMTITKEPGEPVVASDANQASQLAGFAVRLPDGMSPSRIRVTNGSAFTLTVDRAKAEALLKEAGRSDLILPDAIDGAEISVDIPASVSVAYGTCPSSEAAGHDPDMQGYNPHNPLYADCIIFAQIPSPTVAAPPSVNVPQLAQIALEFTGMSSEQAKDFTETVDWTSTLVVPIPRNAATYEQIPVDGVTGTLIQQSSGRDPQYVLLWVRDGIIYMIAGLGSDADQAIQMADSLR
ncbi:MAG: DUF4367 domain-containing protein [Anaerolineales bacterium]|nr:DUF4367 domain-containing protein [Anaerolineales bacterium]